MLRAFDRAIDGVAANADVRCLIVHGGDAKAFCAGSNINEFSELRGGGNASERKILVEDMVLRKLARLACPTIAAIDGPALGGGFEIALACDLRVCRREVALGTPECRLGGLAGSGSVRLARLVGPSRAKELLFLGETIPTGQALSWGLVNRVVDGVAGAALKEARRMAAIMATRGPLSLRYSKQLVDMTDDVGVDAALSMSTVLQQKIFDSADLHQGAAAFFAKSGPEFVGR